MAKKLVFKDTDRGARRVMRALGSSVPTLRVGVLSPDADVLAYNGGTKALGEVAAANELGIGVPKRPFLRGWFDAVKAQLVDDLQEAMQQALLYGNAEAARKDIEWRLAILGRQYVDAIKESIQTQAAGLKQNAKATVEKKGFDHPLVEKGQLVDALSHDFE